MTAFPRYFARRDAVFTAGPVHAAAQHRESQAVVALADVERAERYRPREYGVPGTISTFCNVFVSDVTRWLGAEVPRHWGDMDRREGALSHRMARRVRERRVARRGRWLEASDAASARSLAERRLPSRRRLGRADAGARAHRRAGATGCGRHQRHGAQAGAALFSHGQLARGFQRLARAAGVLRSRSGPVAQCPERRVSQRWRVVQVSPGLHLFGSLGSHVGGVRAGNSVGVPGRRRVPLVVAAAAGRAYGGTRASGADGRWRIGSLEACVAESRALTSSPETDGHIDWSHGGALRLSRKAVGRVIARAPRSARGKASRLAVLAVPAVA